MNKPDNSFKIHEEKSDLSKLIYKFSANPIQIQICFVLQIGKLILKHIWKDKVTRAKTILKKNNKVGRFVLPSTYNKTM